MDKYQELVENVKEYIKEKEAAKGTALTDEDFACEDSPCKSKPETINKGGNIFWVIDGVTIIDRSNEKLIDNSIAFNGLLRILASKPEVVQAAKEIAEERAEEEREKKLHEKLGADYDLVYGKTDSETQKPKRRPGAVQLRTSVPRIAAIDMRDGICEVFSNGYAIYDNGDRKCVIWVPDCGIASYYFGGLKENEKKYLPQHDEVDMGEFPWYNAVLIAGENRIEYNMDHPKSVGTSSDFDLDEVDVEPAAAWIGAAHFDDPETAYLKKEAAEEIHQKIRGLEKADYEMIEKYYFKNSNQENLSIEYGMTQSGISRHLKKVRKDLEGTLKEYY